MLPNKYIVITQAFAFNCYRQLIPIGLNKPTVERSSRMGDRTPLDGKRSYHYNEHLCIIWDCLPLPIPAVAISGLADRLWLH